MIDQGPRLTAIVKDEIKKQAIGKGLNPDEIGHYVGKTMLAIPRNGPPSMELTWFVALTLRLPLLGSEKPTLEFPVVVPSPLPGFMPPDVAFRSSVEIALDKLNEMRSQAMSAFNDSGLPVMGETMAMPPRG